jgi:hypothetical protein
LRCALVIAPAGLFLGGWIALAQVLPEGQIGARAKYWADEYAVLLLVPIILAFVSFVRPLWSVHQNMATKRAEVLGILARLDWEIESNEHDLLGDAPSIDADEATARATRIDSMRATRQRFGGYPTWPVNTRIVARFALSQVVPIATFFQVPAIVTDLLRGVVESFTNS